jgi:hypothetical protein
MHGSSGTTTTAATTTITTNDNNKQQQQQLALLSAQVGSVPAAEPFSELLAQGMVRGRTHKDPRTGRYLKPNEVRTCAGGLHSLRGADCTG